jgi:hypothetical protein
MDSSPLAKGICCARPQQFLKLININALEKDKAMKVDYTTTTLQDKGRADAAQDLENKDLSCRATAVDGATDVASPNPPLLA